MDLATLYTKHLHSKPFDSEYDAWDDLKTGIKSEQAIKNAYKFISNLKGSPFVLISDLVEAIDVAPSLVCEIIQGMKGVQATGSNLAVFHQRGVKPIFILKAGEPCTLVRFI